MVWHKFYLCYNRIILISITLFYTYLQEFSLLNQWVKFQSFITSMRTPAGIMLAIFICIATVFFAFTAPSLQLAYKHTTAGFLTDFDDLTQTGLKDHQFQAARLSGLVAYDQSMDLIGENNHVINRFTILRDEATRMAVLVKINGKNTNRSARMQTVEGIIRRMAKSDYDDFVEFYGNEIEALQSEGWQFDPGFYINEAERLPDPQDIHGMLIFSAVIGGLILLTLVPLLVPLPKAK
jgi:hypothetical protein